MPWIYTQKRNKTLPYEKKTVENPNSFYQDNWINQYRLYRTAHYSLGSKCLWEFLVLNLKTPIDIGINDYTSCTPE